MCYEYSVNNLLKYLKLRKTLSKDSQKNKPYVKSFHHFQIICFVLGVVSTLPKIQENMPKSGLLQASCITMYIMYLTVRFQPSAIMSFARLQPPTVNLISS